MPLLLRSEKGSALTYEELDANFQGLANGEFITTSFEGTYEYDSIIANVSIDTPTLNVDVANITTTNAGIVNATIANASGAIVQQKFVVSGPTRQTIASITPVKIVGLEASITPLYADSIIEIVAYISSTNTFVNSYAIYKNDLPTVSTTGYVNNNQADMQFSQYVGNISSDYMNQAIVYHYETAGDMTTRTYAAYATSGWNGTVYTTYINNRGSNDLAAFSYMTIKEIRP